MREHSQQKAASVSIDSGPPTQVNTVGPVSADSGNLTSEAVFSVGGLAPGTHTMVIALAGSGYVAVDAFWVTPIPVN